MLVSSSHGLMYASSAQSIQHNNTMQCIHPSRGIAICQCKHLLSNAWYCIAIGAGGNKRIISGATVAAGAIIGVDNYDAMMALLMVIP